VAAVAAVGLLAPPVLPQTAVRGDQAAWAEVTAAYRKLSSLSGYRMTLALFGQAGATVEVVPPDRWHATVPASGSEYIAVGTNGAVRRPGGSATWYCWNTDARYWIPRAPATAPGTLTIARVPDTRIDDLPVRAYLIVASEMRLYIGGAAASEMTVYVGVQTGLPRRIVLASSETWDVSDYGARITIRVPPCRTR